jgi:hypothetical protein
MILHVGNKCNLGDNIQSLMWLQKCLEINDIDFIHYYARPEIVINLPALINPKWYDKFEFHDIKGSPKSYVELWLGQNGWIQTYHKTYQYYDQVMFHWYSVKSEEMGLKNPLHSSLDLLFDHPLLKKDLDIDIDILLGNCEPKSEQFKYDAGYWLSAIDVWEGRGLKVVTLGEYMPDMLIHGPWNYITIAMMACRAKKVVSICTGPLHLMFNTRSIQTVKEWHIFHGSHSYSYNSSIYSHTLNEEVLELSRQ